MKKSLKILVSVAILFLVFAILLCSCALSESQSRNAVEFFMIDNDEYKKVLSVAELEISDYPDIGHIVSGYPLFWFTSYGKSLSDSLVEQRSFSCQLRDWYLWCLTTDNNKKIYLVKDNDNWRVYKITEVYVDNSVSFGIINLEISYNKILNSSIKDITKTYFAEDTGTGTNFIIILTKNDEYIIPYFTNPDISIFTDGEIYTSKEMIEEIQRWYLGNN